MSLKKKSCLAALTLLPLACAAADGVRVYGRLDIGPLYQSNPKVAGEGIALDEVSANRLGFIGEENISNDLSAFFRLEHRFNLKNGTERSGRLGGSQFWTDKAWVGIKSKTYGELSAGRVLTVGNSIVGGGNFEAMTDSIGSINSRKGRIENNIDSGVFYESPWFKVGGDVRFVAQITLPGVQGSEKPYGLGFQYKNGPFKLDAGYQHDGYKDGSDQTAGASTYEDRLSNSFFSGAAYDFGSFKLKGTLASSRGYKGDVKDHSPYRMRTASVSLNKEFGKWDLGLMATRKEEVSTSGSKNPDINKFAVGYWYSFSKRTKFMPTIAYERLSGAYVVGKSSSFGVNRDKRDNLYLQLGFRHEF